MPTGYRVLLQHKEVLWSGTTLSSSWPGGPSTGPAGLQSVPLMNEGPYAGLVGIPIGSRVLITVAGDPGAGGAAGQTTAVVVDLVARAWADRRRAARMGVPPFGPASRTGPIAVGALSRSTPESRRLSEWA